MRTKLIFSAEIAQKLTEKNNILLKTVPNLSKPGMVCFLFLYNEKFEKDFGDIVTQKELSER